MKFITMVRCREGLRPPAALFAEVDKLSQEAAKAGVFVATGGLMPMSAGTISRLSGGKITVTDGPFAEAKEVIGGYAIYETRTREEAQEWVRRLLELHRVHWPEWEGEVELRQLVDGPPPTA